MLLVSRRERELDGGPGDRQVHALAMVVYRDDVDAPLRDPA